MAVETNPNEPGREATAVPSGDAAPADKGPSADERIAALEAQNKELNDLARGAVDRAKASEDRSEASRAYVEQLTGALEAAAARAGNGGPGAADAQAEADAIREKLAQDPMAVLDAHYKARTAPLVKNFAENQAQMNRDLFHARTDKKLVERYGKEVDTFMEKFPPEQRAQPGAFEAALKWVRGNHLDDEIKERVQEALEAEKRSHMEPATASAANGAPKRSLTEIEKKVAEGLGLTNEEYLHYKENPNG